MTGEAVIVHYDSLTVISSEQGGETLLEIYTPTWYSLLEEDGDFSLLWAQVCDEEGFQD